MRMDQRTKEIIIIIMIISRLKLEFSDLYIFVSWWFNLDYLIKQK